MSTDGGQWKRELIRVIGGCWRFVLVAVRYDDPRATRFVVRLEHLYVLLRRRFVSCSFIVLVFVSLLVAMGVMYNRGMPSYATINATTELVKVANVYLMTGLGFAFIALFVLLLVLSLLPKGRRLFDKWFKFKDPSEPD